MPEFEKQYKKTSHEIHDEELIEKDDFGSTPEEIEKNTTAVLEKYDREANVRIYKGISRRIVRVSKTSESERAAIKAATA